MFIALVFQNIEEAWNLNIFDLIIGDDKSKPHQRKKKKLADRIAEKEAAKLAEEGAVNIGHETQSNFITQPSSHEMKMKHNQTLCRYTDMFSWDENVLMFCFNWCQDFSGYSRVSIFFLLHKNHVKIYDWFESC
jgi:hypothetical protein